jgi:hypothetical protein
MKGGANLTKGNMTNDWLEKKIPREGPSSGIDIAPGFGWLAS